MIVQCQACRMFFEDEYRFTFCPHEAFLANDGRNNFAVHHEAYLSPEELDDRQSHTSSH